MLQDLVSIDISILAKSMCKDAFVSHPLARMPLYRPQRECTGEALHGHAIVPLPSQLLVLPAAEPVDVFLGRPDRSARFLRL